jgi:hypothetical protein
MGYRAKVSSMDTYEIKIPKALVWLGPILFASAFALFFILIAKASHLPYCSEFATQSDAQRLLLADPAKYGYLDRNGDGIACNGI